MSDTRSTHIKHGSVVVDRDGSDSRAIVVSKPPVPAHEWHIPGRGSLAEDNPEYPADDRVIAVVYADTLEEFYPYYSGIKPFALSDLNERGVKFYTFPASRLKVVERVTDHTIPLDAITPSPYHSRSFCAAENRGYIETIREQGDLENYPLLRPIGDHFEILNGHKRCWAAHVAGLESITAQCLYIDDEQAARTFANAHLPDYGAPEREKATSAIEADLDRETAQEVLS